jgi:hypothetical protein
MAVGFVSACTIPFPNSGRGSVGLEYKILSKRCLDADLGRSTRWENTSDARGILLQDAE